jgi:hypothetical protein
MIYPLKTGFLITMFMLPTLCGAVEVSSFEKLDRGCQREQTSLFRDNNGVPTCLLVARLLREREMQIQPALDEAGERCAKQQRSLFKDNNGTPACEVLAKIQLDWDERRIPVDNPVAFRWNTSARQYCWYYNDPGKTYCP